MAEAAKKATGGNRQARTGTVTSVSGNRTVRVVIENLVKQAQYGKYIRRRTKLAVHDPKGAASLGDVVEVVPCRRVSKTKSWQLVRVIRPAEAVEVEPQRSDQ